MIRRADGRPSDWETKQTDRQTGERDRDMQAVNGVQRRVDAQGQLLQNPLFGCPSPPRPQLSFNTKLLIIENR